MPFRALSSSSASPDFQHKGQSVLLICYRNLNVWAPKGWLFVGCTKYMITRWAWIDKSRVRLKSNWVRWLKIWQQHQTAVAESESNHSLHWLVGRWRGKLINIQPINTNCESMSNFSKYLTAFRGITVFNFRYLSANLQHHYASVLEDGK